MTERARYRLVAWLCTLLRHPSRRTEYAGAGGALTRCPCGHIEIADRGFRVDVR